MITKYSEFSIMCTYKDSNEERLEMAEVIIPLKLLELIFL